MMNLAPRRLLAIETAVDIALRATRTRAELTYYSTGDPRARSVALYCNHRLCIRWRMGMGWGWF